MGRMVRRNGGRQYIPTSEQVIGRSKNCELCLEGVAVSGAHASLRWRGTHWELRDLGSRNGTMVNSNSTPKGEWLHLSVGALITFGDNSESWHLVNADGPEIQVVHLNGSAPLLLENNVIAIPDSTAPTCSIFQVEGRWHLEFEECVRPIASKFIFTVNGNAMRFECPVDMSRTPACFPEIELNTLELCFQVSRDEESVSLELEGSDGNRVLPIRSCFYLGLVLARRLLRDLEKREPDPGWLELKTLATLAPELASASLVNVAVHRFRRQLGAANIVDAGRIVEPRPGQLRLGTSRVRVERQH